MGDFITQFAIKPGTHTQSIYIPEDNRPEHFYIHVSGQPIERRSDFGVKGVQGILGERPAKYVPFKVAIYDEPLTNQLKRKARNAGADPGNVKPVYNWVYRPEMQFSLFDLEQQRIKLQKNDGTSQVIDLTGDPSKSASGESIIAQLTGNTLDYAELLYDLTGPAFEELARFSDDRQLVFSIGGEEALATLSPGGTVRFENGVHLNSLDDIDLLSIRLYQANDAANVLWQYNLSGVYAYYKIPHVVRWLKKTESSPVDNKEFRILGGMRVRFEYAPEPDEKEILKYEWRFKNAGSSKNTGRFKQGFEFSSPELMVTNVDSDTVYWEPNDWRADHDIKGTLKITYIDNKGAQKTRTRTFKVSSRVLAPKAPGSELQGTDVAMLEELLWQLGLSPQKGSPGSEGARIKSDRGKNRRGINLGQTKVCGNRDADKRSVFYSGWANCANGEVSLEVMVRRYQARRNATSANKGGNKVTGALLNQASASVDDATLGNLKKDWSAYSKAYNELSGSGVILAEDTQMKQWIKDAVEIWDKGKGIRVPVNTYTEATHAGILRLAGVTADKTNTRNIFLRNWITHESTYHWGNNIKNNQPSPYRMTEGGADEHGSLSFSQLLYGHRYGLTPCAAHAEAGLNLYHPGDNVKTFVVHTASDNGVSTGQTRCKGMMYAGFIEDSLRKQFSVDTAAIDASAGDVNDLRGYYHRAGSVTVPGSREDNYEALAKAVIGYNGGETYAKRYSWAKLLKYRAYDASSDRNSGGTCHSCRYSIEVRGTIFGNNLRTYIWEGGKGVDVNNNGTIDIIPADPSTTPPTPAIDESTAPWCFAYGEKEWVGGKVFSKVRSAAIGTSKKLPIGRVNCVTGGVLP